MTSTVVAPVPRVNDANRPFYEAAAAGRFILQRCARCARWIYYPRVFCPYCLSPDLEWKPASGRGQIHSYAIVHHPAHDYFNDKVPILLAAVRLVEGPIMVASVKAQIDELTIDAPVHVVFDLKVDELTIPRFALGDG